MDGYWDERYQEEVAKHEANMMRADDHVYKLEDEIDKAQQQARQLRAERDEARKSLRECVSANNHKAGMLQERDARIAELEAVCRESLHLFEHHESDLSYLGELSICRRLREALEVDDDEPNRDDPDPYMYGGKP